jgi:HEAT repeat protein
MTITRLLIGAAVIIAVAALLAMMPYLMPRATIEYSPFISHKLSAYAENPGRYGTEYQKIMIELGARVIPDMEVALKDSDPRIRDAALTGLYFCQDPGGISGIISCLSDADPHIRASACHYLATFTENKAVEPLKKCALDSDADVRNNALCCLAGYDFVGKKDYFSQYINDPVPVVRGSAQQVIREEVGKDNISEHHPTDHR